MNKRLYEALKCLEKNEEESVLAGWCWIEIREQMYDYKYKVRK